MKITYNKLFEIIDGLNALGNNLGQDKFAYVVSKNTIKFQSILKKFNEKVFDINLDNAQVDEKGNLVKDSKGEFVYTREAAKAKESAIRELREEEIEIDFYALQDLTKVIYKRLGVVLCDVFAGTLLITEQVEKADKEWSEKEVEVEEVQVKK